MNIFEKAYSLLAIVFAVGLITIIILYPEFRRLERLILTSLIGFAVNIGLMFIVLKDIFMRRFNRQGTKYLWLAMVLLVWPSIIYYLFQYGFKSRSGQESLIVSNRNLE
ncbi:MAG: hypothetical protein KJ630_10305 [Proteobacteria bacterium]|nr:hypothetical protein [Pseudomonadota bacterium]